MFKINGMDFSHGTDLNREINGAQVMIMQSQENLHMVLPEFERAIATGYNPNDAKEIIFKHYNLTDDDFTGFDAELLIKRVEAMYKASQY